MMASLTDRNFAIALRSLSERDEKLADLVESEDSQLDELEMSVDEQVIQYVATKAPVATDCRFMLVASKISSNLEEIADQTVTIARRARHLARMPVLPIPINGIAPMAKLAEGMCRDAITALVEQKPELAQQVITRDKSVDGYYKEITKDLTRLMVLESGYVERLIHWIFIAKAIERLADYAKNNAEEVYYLYQAVDIRHGSKPGA